MTVSAQRITRSFHDVSLSDALKYIQSQTTDYDIIFIYDELEDFRVTTDVHHKSVLDAIVQVVGFYPVRVYQRGKSEIYVECIHRTDCHLTGTIMNEQGQLVAYANVTILSPQDSTLLSGGVSNESGYFAIPYDAGPVLVRISYVGYKTVWRLCDKSDVGTIKMYPETLALKGVTVKGQTPILRRNAGTIILDARQIAGAINVTDLLRYSPGVHLFGDDISLFGTSGIIFCINGKEQRMGTKEMLQMLKSFPASDVERIEIIQSPGSNYSAEGNAGIINIVLGKHGNDYIGGSASYARTQYEEYGDEANASIIYNKGKISTSMNLSGLWDHTIYRETNAIDFTGMKRTDIDDGHIGKDNYSLRWQMDYNVSNKLNFGAYMMYSDGERSLSIDGLYDFQPKSIHSINGIVTQTRRQEDTRTLAVNFNAAQELGVKGAKIDYNLDYYRMRMGDERHSMSNNTMIGNSLTEIVQTDTTDFDYQNHIAQNVDYYSAKVDVSYANFRFGTQYAYTRSHRDLDFSDARAYSQASNTHNEQIMAGYVEYDRHFGHSWTVNLGGRYEHTWTKDENLPVTSESKTDYGKLFPSLRVGYNPTPSHTFNWSLNCRITRPNIINLNPNRVWKDVNHVSYGNQNLKPSYLYKAMMGYTYKGTLSCDLNYAYESDRIDAIYLVDKQITYNTWDNITDVHDLGINSFYYFNKLRWMTAILMQGVWYSKTVRSQKETVMGIVRQYLYPKVENFSYVGMLQATFYLDRDHKWTSNLNATYNSPEKDVTKSLDARYMVDVGMQYRFWKNRLSVGFTCRNLFASRIKGTEYLDTTAMDFNNKYNYQQFHLTLAYNWGAQLHHNKRRYESDEMQERIVNDF